MSAHRVRKDNTAAVVIARFGRHVDYSDHVRVAITPEGTAHEAVCFTCHSERRGPYPVGPERKYYGVAVRDAIAHLRAAHGFAR